MKRILLLLVVLFALSACSVKAVDVQTLTIPPHKDPVTVTVKGTATCRDNFLYYQVFEKLDVVSSDGSKATQVSQ